MKFKSVLDRICCLEPFALRQAQGERFQKIISSPQRHILNRQLSLNNPRQILRIVGNA